MLGVAAGAVWVAGRRFLEKTSRLIDWGQVRRIAIATSRKATSDQPAAIPHKEERREHYAEMVRRAERPIADYTGKTLPRPLDAIYIFDRADWIDANIANFQLLFKPFEEMNQEALRYGSVGVKLAGEVNQIVISSQLGLLMGYLAQRVLGQYDLSVLGREPVTNGRLYFVEPNISALRERLSLDANEFEMWIVLHETTHAYEFEANPWLQGYMNSLLTRYFQTISKDFGGMQWGSSGVRSLVSRIGSNIFTSSNVLEMMMTPEQRHIFQQLQALMCLLEGFSNHIMQEIGKTILPSYECLKERFDERGKNKSAAERLFTKLTGLDIKMEQYALGERFVNDIVERRGVEFVNQVWQSPLSLPTMDEVRTPDKWIKRMERMAIGEAPTHRSEL